MSHPGRQRGAAATDGPPAGPPASTAWLDVSLDTVEENLALDEALLELAQEGAIATRVVRTWMATEPVVVVGASSRVAEEVDRDACEALGVRIVRRPTGGLTVVLGPGCLMWSVVERQPAAAPAIAHLHEALLGPLRDTLASMLAPAGRIVARRGASDLVLVDAAGDRKFSGNALRVRRHAVLYHGTLLDDFDLGLVSSVLRHPPREPEYRARRPHGAFLTNLGVGRGPLERGVREAFSAREPLGDWPRERVRRLVAERYGRADWTHRL